MFNEQNKGKITITIEGLSGQGLGKTTVTAIIMQALEEYGYVAHFCAIPGMDHVVGASPSRVDVDTQRELLFVGRTQKTLDKQASVPHAFISLIEKV